MEEAGKAQNLPMRKVLYQFEQKIDALPSEVLRKAEQEMVDHISMMMKEAFSSNGKAALFN